MSEDSVTSADQYIDYVRRKRGLDFPETPQTCVICHSELLVGYARRAFPHQRVDIGVTTSAPVFYFTPASGPAFAMTFGHHGAPMAAVILEELIALGFRRFLVVGSAGHPCEDGNSRVQVGDIVLPTEARVFEGTSAHYRPGTKVSRPLDGVIEELQASLERCGAPFIAGPVATTDALYRETPSFIAGLVEGGVLALDMELSAMFTVAGFHGRPLSGLFYISDRIQSQGKWHSPLLAGVLNRVQETLFDILLDYVKSGADGREAAADSGNRQAAS
jgi:uridine phosphorylase